MDENLRKLERAAKSDASLIPQFIRAVDASSDSLGLVFRILWWANHSGALRDALGVPGPMMSVSWAREGDSVLLKPLDGISFYLQTFRRRSRASDGPLRTIESSKIVVACPVCSMLSKKKNRRERLFDVTMFIQHARGHLPGWLTDHFQFQYVEIKGEVQKFPLDPRSLNWIYALVDEAWDEPPRKNPLHAKHTGVQSANPVPPEIEEMFKSIMHRNLLPEDHEGVHAALYARISVEYAFSASEANGAAPALVTLNKVGLTPSLDVEGIAIKKLLTQERHMIKSVIEMVDADQPENAGQWLEQAASYYEYEEVNPFAALMVQFWRPPEELVTLLKEWIKRPSDQLIIDIVGSQRFLNDVPASHIIAIEELRMVNDKLEVKPLFVRPGVLASSPDYLYHGTTLKNLREALKGEIDF